MLKIDEIEINKMIINLKEEVYKLFYTNIIMQKKIDYEIVFNIAKDEVIEMIVHTENISDSLYENIIKETMNKKDQWIRYEMNNDKSLYKETIDKAKFMFDENTSNIGNCNNINEYISELNKELKEWKNNKKQDLTHFKYIKRKRVSTIKRALIDDIKVFLLKKIIENYKQNKTKFEFEIQPNSLIDSPTDPTNLLPLQNAGKKFTYDYKIGEEKILYEIKLKDVENTSIVEQSSKVIKQILRVLNDKDVTIFQHLLKHRVETFFQNGIIKFFLDDLCKEINGYSSTDRKNEIISSLTKMSMLKSRGYTENKSGIMTSLIGDIIIDSSKGKKTEVTITIGLTYINEIINGNVTKVYTYLLDAVGDNAYARKLLFFLQKERIIIHYNKDKNEIEKYTQKRVPYTYFARVIIFTNKRKSKTIQRIKEALDIIVESGAILLEYKLNGDFFDLYYKPLSYEELKDLEMRIDAPMEITT